METTQTLDFEEFKKNLAPNRLLVFKIVHSALFLGASMFLGIVILMAWQHANNSTNSPGERPQGSWGTTWQHADNSTNPQDILPALTIAHVIVALPCYLAGAILYRYMTGLSFFRKMNVAAASPGNVTLEQRYFVALFTAYIIRAAFFEGVALFGLIVCLMGIINGQIERQPIYWLNLLSYVTLAVLIVWAFPSRSRLEAIFKKRCVPKPPHVC